MDEKELNDQIEVAVKLVIEWANAKVNTIDREMLDLFSLPIGAAHLTLDISSEELATTIILCMIASYNLGAKSMKSAVVPRTVKLDD